MQSSAATVEQYLAELEPERRESVETIRRAVLEALPEGYEERMQWGMIGYCVPHSIYPKGYHCDPKQPLPFAAIAAQKNYLAVHLFCLYADGAEGARFAEAWKATGKRLDMGKSCVRARRAEDLALDVIADTISRLPVAEHVARYEGVLAESAARQGRRKAS